MTNLRPLSTTRAAAMYVGALLGPSLLLLPGLAVDLAGPASILVWVGLLGVSAMLARVFTALGVRLPTGGGVAAYTAAGLGPRAGRAVGWCFLAGVELGAPVVCLIGGSYVAVLLGGGRTAGVAAAAVLLAVVLALTLGGARATTTAQLVLVAVLTGLVAVAVGGSAHAARAGNWTPFAPHGWASTGGAASVVMLSFVGWEAIAPLTARLRDPARQLPRVIAIAFAVTATAYLAVAAATVGVLGGGSAVPLTDLLRVAIGSAGPVVAAVAAVALTLAATNAYLTGAAVLAAELRRPHARARRHPSRRLQLGIAATGALVLLGTAAGVLGTARLVALPTTLFLTVYLGCTAAAARVLAGRTRVVAAVSCGAVALVLVFAGWALAVAALVAAVGALTGASAAPPSPASPSAGNPAPASTPPARCS